MLALRGHLFTVQWVTFRGQYISQAVTVSYQRWGVNCARVWSGQFGIVQNCTVQFCTVYASLVHHGTLHGGAGRMFYNLGELRKEMAEIAG